MSVSQYHATGKHHGVVVAMTVELDPVEFRVPHEPDSPRGQPGGNAVLERAQGRRAVGRALARAIAIAARSVVTEVNAEIEGEHQP